MKHKSEIVIICKSVYSCGNPNRFSNWPATCILQAPKKNALIFPGHLRLLMMAGQKNYLSPFSAAIPVRVFARGTDG
jgi:hypothetical protein